MYDLRNIFVSELHIRKELRCTGNAKVWCVSKDIYAGILCNDITHVQKYTIFFNVV